MSKAVTIPAPLAKGLQHKTMAGAAVEVLRRRILDGELPSGTQLRQSALAEEFGISRIPLREAFLQLEAEGLVKVQAHRGAVVASLSNDEVAELFELRATLEPMLLRRSAPNLTAENFNALQSLLDDYASDLNSASARRWGVFNAQFHLMLYAKANRPRTMALVQNLLQDSDRHTRLHLSIAGATARAQDEHSRILSLCRAGDIDAAATLLRSHIVNVAEELRQIQRG